MWEEILKIIGELIVIGGFLSSIVLVAFKKFTKSINKELKEIKETNREKDIEDSRVKIDSFLNRVKYHYDEIDDEEWMLYHSIYDRYTNVLNQNSYIHTKWERIVKDEDKH